MYSREIDSIFFNLKQLLGIQEEAASMADVAQQLEKAVAGKKIFNDDVVKSFKAAKQKDGRFVIEYGDNILIKNIKVTINLLVTMNKVDMEVFTKLQKYINSDSNNKIERIKGFVELGAKAFEGAEQLKQLRNDMHHFMFYANRLKAALPSLADIQVNANDKLQELQDAFSELQIVQAKEAVSDKFDEVKKEKLNKPIPNLEKIDFIYDAVSGYGLETNIDALVEMSANLCATQVDYYDKDQQRFVGASDKRQIIYNTCRDIKLWMAEAEKLIRQISNIIRINGKWSDLDEKERLAYIQLNNNLKNIDGAVTNLMPLCAADPLLTQVFKRNAELIARQKSVLSDWANSQASQQITDISVGATDILAVANAVIENNIAKSHKDKYFDQQTELYVMPDKSNDPDDVGDLTVSDRNLMLVHNVNILARNILQELEVVKQASFPANVNKLLNVLKSTGNLVSAFKKIERKEIKADAIALVQHDLAMMFQQIISIYEGALALASESELRLNLQSGRLLSRLQPIGDALDGLIGVEGLGLKVKISVVSCPEIKGAAQAKIAAENKVHKKKLEEVSDALRREIASLPDVLKQMSVLQSIDSYGASVYSDHLHNIVLQMTGLDILEAGMKARESAILDAVSQEQMMSSKSLLSTDAQRIDGMSFSSEIKAKIKRLKELYVMQSELNKLIENVKKVNSPGGDLADIIIKHFNVITEGVINKTTAYQLKLGAKKPEPALLKKANELRAVVLQEIEEQGNIDSAEDLTNSIINSDASHSVATLSVQVYSDASEVAVAALDNNDCAIVKNLIDKKKGPIVLQSEAARKELLLRCLPLLADDQQELFSLDDKGLYREDAKDKFLNRAIKATYNTMLTFEELMLHVNKMRRVLAGGYLGYRKIPGLIAAIKDKAGELQNRISSMAEVMNEVHGFVKASPLHVDMLLPFTMLNNITQYLPGQLHALNEGMSIELVQALVPGLVDNIKKILGSSAVLEHSSLELSPLAGGARAEDLEASTSITKFMNSTLNDNALIPCLDEIGSHLRLGIENEDMATCARALDKAFHKLKFAMNGAEEYANGHTLSGLFGVIKNLYSVWSLINESNAITLAENSKNTIEQQLFKMKKMLNEKMANCLKQLDPALKNVRDVMVKHAGGLGLKQSVVLEQFDHYLSLFNGLASKYRSVPQLNERGGATELEDSMTSKSTLYDLMGENENSRKLNEHKIRSLLVCCMDYKHHLAEALHRELVSAYPGNSFAIDLNQALVIDQNILKNNDVLRLTVHKYKAVHRLQAILQSPRDNLSAKVEEFSKALAIYTPIFAKRRDSAGDTFLKAVATIFSFGLAALFGIWRTHGDSVTKDMASLVKHQPDSRP